MPILGHIVGNGQVCMEPNKMGIINGWLLPKNKKEVQKFNGFGNFYQRYIKGYSSIAKPITRLTGDVEFKWTEEEQKAFETLKKKIKESKGITLLKENGKFRVEVDASGYALGGVLSQQQEGKWKIIAFIS